MRVVEIFKSIEGEGKRAGLPAVFIRLFGCNLRCVYCDTPYGYEGHDYTEMTSDEILKKVNEFGVPYVTVTGGEPLIHEGITELLKKLTDSGYFVNVETNGTIKPTFRNSHIFYTVDYKCKGSGMNHSMHPDVFTNLTKDDVIKCVVSSKEDMEEAVVFLNSLSSKTRASVYFSPVWGKIEPVEIVDFLLENKLYECRVQLQIHKIIWDPNKRGV